MGNLDPVLGHDYVTEETAATCKESGYTLITCSRCDYEEKTNETAVDHDSSSAALSFRTVFFRSSMYACFTNSILRTVPFMFRISYS